MSDIIIFYIGGFNFPDKDAASHRVIANAKLLQKIGYTTIFFCMTKESNCTKQEPVLKEIGGFQYFEYKYPASYKEWYNWLTKINYIKTIKVKPSIIIAYNYPSVALYKLKLYSQKQNIKLIADCTEWYQSTNLIKILDTYFRMRILHPKMDGVISISRFLYDYYSNFKCQNLLLPPLVDITDEKWKENNSDISHNNIKLVYAGNIGNGKKDDLLFIVESLERIRYELELNIHLDIYGIIEKDYCSIYRINNDKLNSIKNYITFHGVVEHTIVIKAIQNADFTIFIRHNNIVNNAGFPTKFVESISCGTPVLTNYNSNISEYIVEGKNGFIFISKTKDDFCNSLIKVFKNITPEKIEKMKFFCRENNAFDYRLYIPAMIDFINK